MCSEYLVMSFEPSFRDRINATNGVNALPIAIPKVDGDGDGDGDGDRDGDGNITQSEDVVVQSTSYNTLSDKPVLNSPCRRCVFVRNRWIREHKRTQIRH